MRYNSRLVQGLHRYTSLSFAKTLQRHKSRPVTMLRARPHAIHFKRILDFGEGQPMKLVLQILLFCLPV
jgi:hypothetical protein